MRRRRAWVIGTVVAALGCSPPPPPKPSPVPMPTAVSETPDASAAPTPTETATDAAAPSTAAAAPVPEACRATTATPLDIGAAMAAEACRADLGDAGTIPALPSGVSLRVEPESLSVASGRYLVFYVVLENGGASPVDVILERVPDFFGSIGEASFGELGHGFGTGAGVGTASGRAKRKPGPPPVPVPKETSTPGFSVGAAFDAKSRSTAFPAQAFGMIGLLGTAPKVEGVHFVLPPSTRARGTVVWQATGYDPTKNYMPKQKQKNPNEGFMIPPPEPLKPGKYQLSVDLPAKRGNGEDLTTTASVEVTP